MKDNLNLSYEILTIIECCKEKPSKEKLTLYCQKIIDWNDFIYNTTCHGVLPLVYLALKNMNIRLPQNVLFTLRSLYFEIAKENMMISSKLIKLKKLFDLNSIEFISFKGALLTDEFYENITLRQYRDIDILINEQDLDMVYNFLVNELNFTTETKYSFLRNNLFLDKASDIQFFRDNLLVEVHWKLFRDQFSKEIKKVNFFNTDKYISFHKHKFKRFLDEYYILYLCMHGSKHCWERISWILDIDKFLKKNNSINWDKLLEFSSILECKVMLKLGLYMAYILFKTPLPLKIKKLICEDKNNMELKKYIIMTYDNIEEKTEFSKNYKEFKFYYSIQDSFYIKLKFLVKTFLPITLQDILEVNLRKELYFLYYFIKPFRLIYKYLLKFIK